MAWHLTIFEKGDAVIELAEVEGKTYKEIADKELNVAERTIYDFLV
jgi:DNA-directed RNA polymerase specialized sigma24 family protein